MSGHHSVSFWSPLSRQKQTLAAHEVAAFAGNHSIYRAFDYTVSHPQQRGSVILGSLWNDPTDIWHL
jgi:hypothetical protein